MEIQEGTDSAQILITLNEPGYEIDVFEGTPLTKQAIEEEVNLVVSECRDCDEEVNVIDLANKIKKEIRNE